MYKDSASLENEVLKQTIFHAKLCPSPPFPFSHTAQKMKSSIKDFFSKYDQIRSLLRIWSHSLKKSIVEKFIFCAVP